ncbi:kinase-like protein [Saccharata proteae CBS 121410]|uniref:non-specific serine/threonine protein kinase n=1 Tax=Saccharata proteae CBS 121410 TaxID=1314787 RepID=A0A9P4HMX5_9PEZI|nr:kinase-like protein [Saccharata proteae CBS 121410]
MHPLDFICSVDAEPLDRYKEGGYHPVCLGDLLKDGRYKVIHKIGFGAYSTVWVARDQQAHRYVAIKVNTSDIGILTRETLILRTLSAAGQSCDSHPGSNHVVQFLDDFTVTGPNGTHTCLVLELLGPSIQSGLWRKFHDGRLPREYVYGVSKQAVLGLDYLHRNGIGHGDIHTGNLVFTLLNLDDLIEEEFFARFTYPATGSITRKDGAPLNKGMPEYLVWPMRFRAKDINTAASVKLVDFGESFLADNKPPSLNTPKVLCAPELIFKDEWDYYVDIWSMGCMIFELIAGQPPFGGYFDNERILLLMIISKLRGELPDRWREEWTRMEETRERFKPDVGQEEINEEYSSRTLEEWLPFLYFEDEDKTADLSVEELARVSTVVRKMLRYEPAERISAADALKEEWFRDGPVASGSSKDELATTNMAPTEKMTTENVVTEMAEAGKVEDAKTSSGNQLPSCQLLP